MTEVSINKQVKLSEHFTLGELCKTGVKTADGNIPSHVHIENLKRVCEWLEELRRRYNQQYVCENEERSVSPPELGGARGGLRSAEGRLLPEGRKNEGTVWRWFRPPLAPPNLGGEEITFNPDSCGRAILFPLSSFHFPLLRRAQRNNPSLRVMPGMKR